MLPANAEAAAASVAASAAATATSHGIEVAVEFKPVEHPVEPLDNDRPVQCPLPEPSILNVRRISGFLMLLYNSKIVCLILNRYTFKSLRQY